MGKIVEFAGNSKRIIKDSSESLSDINNSLDTGVDILDKVDKFKKNKKLENKIDIRIDRIEGKIYNLLKRMYKVNVDYNKCKYNIIEAPVALLLFHDSNKKFEKEMTKCYNIFKSLLEDLGIQQKMLDDTRYTPSKEELIELVKEYNLCTDRSLVNILHYKRNKR